MGWRWIVPSTGEQKTHRRRFDPIRLIGTSNVMKRWQGEGADGGTDARQQADLNHFFPWKFEGPSKWLFSEKQLKCG